MLSDLFEITGTEGNAYFNSLLSIHEYNCQDEDKRETECESRVFKTCVFWIVLLLNLAVKPCGLCISQLVNVKVNFTLEQATKAQRGSRGITILFL